MKSLIFIIAFLICITGVAQEFDLSLSRPFSNNQLSSSTVYGVCESDEGYIYIGTETGLYKYNGLFYEKTHTSTQSESAHNLIYYQGKVFYITFANELVCMGNDSITVLDKSDVSISKKSRLKLIDDDLFIIDLYGYSRIDPITLELKDNVDYDRNNNALLHDIYIGEDHELKIITKATSNLGAFSKFKILPIQDSAESRILRLVDFKNETLGFDLINHKFYKLKNGVFSPSDWDLSFLQKQKVNALIFDENNNTLISTHNGLFIYNPKTNYHQHFLKGIPIANVFIDSHKNIWISTLNDGIYFINDLNTMSVDFNDELSKNDKIYKAFFENEKVYLGTHLGKLFFFDLLSSEMISRKLPEDAEIQALYAKNNDIYTYCEKIYHLDKNLNTVDTAKDAATKDFLTTSKGVFRATSDLLSFCDQNGDTIQMLRGNWIRSLTYDLDTNYVISNTDNGAYKINVNDFSIQFEEGKLKCYTNSSLGFNAYIKEDSIIIHHNDKKFNIHKDINILGHFAKDDFYYYFSDQEIIQYSLKNHVITNAWEVGMRLPSKPIISCGVHNQNLVIVFENELQKLPISTSQLYPTPIIHQVDNKDLDFNIPYGSSINLKFDVLSSVSDKGRGKLFYQIDGLNKEWIDLKNNGENYLLKLERLPPGEYELKLQAESYSGQKSDIKIIPLNVAYPYWQKWWFILGCAALLCLCVYIFIRLQITKLNKKNEEKLKLKKLEISSLNSKLEALRSQMNPHFIFNTINTIQSQIIQNGGDEAYNSLNKFAKLIRSSLEMSAEDFVTINNDKDFLENYLALENLRFGGKLNYSIVIQNDLQNINPSIPSLITQPFAENAIKHGLLHKETEPKELKIVYYLEDKNITIRISDNGIGRSASAEINRANKKHKSYSTQAISERITTLNSMNKTNILITTADLNEGTEVTIKLNNAV